MLKLLLRSFNFYREILLFRQHGRYLFLILCSVLLGACEIIKSRYSANVSAPREQAIYRLDLHSQNLTELPGWFDKLNHQELRVINLSDNPDMNMQSAITRICSQAKKLNTLLLADNQLKYLPESISLCHSLSHLSLQSNPQLDFAQALKRLSPLSLEFLDLSDNALYSLPDEITLLVNLRDLRLSANSLSDPQAYQRLGQIPALFSVWLDHNNLTELPQTVGFLRQIHYLFLDNNKLNKLPTTVADMSELRVLHLTQNQFEEIPHVIRNMPKLLVLFIASNRISRIEPTFRDEPSSLKGIVLDNNFLDTHQVALAAQIFRDYFLFSANHH